MNSFRGLVPNFPVPVANHCFGNRESTRQSAQQDAFANVLGHVRDEPPESRASHPGFAVGHRLHCRTACAPTQTCNSQASGAFSANSRRKVRTVFSEEVGRVLTGWQRENPQVRILGEETRNGLFRGHLSPASSPSKIRDNLSRESFHRGHVHVGQRRTTGGDSVRQPGLMRTDAIRVPLDRNNGFRIADCLAGLM